MGTVVVTDSSAVARPRPGVRVVEIVVLLADAEAPDREVDMRTVQAALRRHEPVKTRAPSVVDYVEAIEHGDGGHNEAAVIITPAMEFTVMWRNASNAMYLADRPVAVVDSRTAATGQALVVEAARTCAAQGGALADVVAAAEDASRRVRLVATLGSVDPIATSGILPSATVDGLQPELAQPLFRLDSGRVDVVRLAAPGTDPVAELAELWQEGDGPQSERSVVFASAGDQRANELTRQVGATSIEHPSAAMTVYTGADVLGVAWLT